MTLLLQIERAKLRLEEAKLELEREKMRADGRRLELESRKVDTEIAKARWTGPTVMATIVVATIVFIGGVASQYLQAQAQFKLKASELVLSAQSASQAAANAKALQKLFPDQLPEGFETRFPKDLDAFGPDIIAAKVELLKMMQNEESVEKKAEIQRLWMKLFPDDTTFKR